MDKTFRPQVRDRVRVVRISDNVHPGLAGTDDDRGSTSPYVGLIGRVAKLVFDDVGASFPGDPLCVCVFADAPRDGFWSEELELVGRPSQASPPEPLVMVTCAT